MRGVFLYVKVMWSEVELYVRIIEMRGGRIYVVF